MRRLIILLLVIILSPTLTAQAKVYQIEMIIFSQPTSPNNKMEEWSTSSIPSDLNFFCASQIRPLPASKFLLKNEQMKLSENPGYLTLLHLAWQQSIINLPTHPMRIEGDRVLGLFRVNVQRYFNISLTLLFDKANGLGSWYVSQECRMRSNQLNYIDFLYYGILIKIIPLT